MSCSRFTRQALFLAVFAVLSFAVTSVVGADEVEEAIKKGISYLRGVQNADGSWREYNSEASPGYTVLTALAFLDNGIGEGDATVDKALAYILDKQVTDGSERDGSFATSGSQRQTYVTGLAIMVLTAADNLSGQRKYVTQLTKAKDFLLRKQNADGGWGYPYLASRSDHSCSQFGLMGLHFAYDYLGLAKTDAVWSKAIAYLDNTQCSDGGFPYETCGWSTGSMTGAGLWSYRLCDVAKSDGDVQEALAWISQNYNASWSSNPGSSSWVYYYYWSIAKALQMYGIQFITDRDGNTHDYMRELSVNRLVAIQQTNGSWIGEYWDTSDNTAATSYALMILAMYGGPTTDEYSYSLAFTLTSNDADLHVYGPTGLHVGKDITGRIEIQIEGATISTVGNEFTITIKKDAAHPDGLLSGDYYVEMVPKSSQAGATYDLTLRGYRTELSTGAETDLYGPTTWSDNQISRGHVHCMSPTLSWLAGMTVAVTEGPHENPRMLVAPLTIDLTIVPGGSEQRIITIAETSGEGDIRNVTLGAQQFVSSDGRNTIDPSNITFSQNGFDVPAGGSRQVTVTFNWPVGVVSSSYTSYILVDSDNAGGKQIHVSAATDEFSTLIRIDPEKTYAYAGDRFSVDVVIEHIPSFGLQAANVIVAFDPDLIEYVQAVKGDIIADTWQTPLLTDSTVEFNTSTTTIGGETTDGSMATITFDAKVNAPNDNIPDITFLLVDLRDSENNPIHVSDERKKPGYLIAGQGDCPLLGDFNCDGIIDFEDLVIFTFGWISQDSRVDIGPGQSGTSAPDIIPLPDGKVGIKDLIVFSHMWDWFYTSGPGGAKVIIAAPADVPLTQDVGTVMRPVVDVDAVEVGQEVKVDVWIDDVQDLIAAHAVLTFDPENCEVVTVERGSFLSENGAYVIFMTPLIDEARGAVAINTSCVNGSPLGVDGSGSIATVILRATGEGGVLVSLEECQLRNVDNAAIPVSTRSVAMSVGTERAEEGLGLVRNYPNPANPGTEIEFSLVEDGRVVLTVYNILGQRVRTLVDERRSAGTHTIEWDSTDEEGDLVPVGVYLYGIEVDGTQQMKKLLILR